MGIFSKAISVSTDEKKIDELLSRGVAEVIGAEDLRKRMLAGERLRIKLGIDPTSPNLHLGRSVPLLKMRDFQQLGHQVVLIVGDFTGVIGDTSDKDSERPMLLREAIEKNKKTYFDQVGKLIDLKSAELRYNSEWLEPLTYREIGEHADQFSVADFIARDNIKRRLDEGKRVSLREVLYPLMQGYDSVAIKADVELGGVDQRFNLLAGRTLQEHFKQRPQHIVMTTFPIEGTDGRKMSSSWGNTINFSDVPNEMYGKLMSVRDELVEKYFTLLTRVPLEEISATMQSHPKEIKMRLALEIVSMYHNPSLAKEAQEEWINTFSKGEAPTNIPETSVPVGTKYIDALAALGDSKSELRRLAEQGAISTEHGKKIEDLTSEVSHTVTLRIGKHRFLKIVVK